jgi:hypothetical protein
MLSTQEAFAKFRSRLELTEKEQADASRRQQDIRAIMDENFDVDHDFLTGSYRRHTKSKPLKDVDIFCVLGPKEKHYRKETPDALLETVRKALEKTYGAGAVNTQRRSVCVSFGVTVADDDAKDRVVSFDVVPAFTLGEDYEIPDLGTASWTKTNPRIHAEKAVAAHEAYDSEWKGLVRMMKYWNNSNGKPITPSFLIEVMALEVLQPPFGGDRAREMQFFFDTLAGRIDESWLDPAGLGPPISDGMDAAKRSAARSALKGAELAAARAIAASRDGRQGEALQAWRTLLGPLFPLS